MHLRVLSIDIRPLAPSFLGELQLRFTRIRGQADSVASFLVLLRSAFLPKRGRWHQITFRGIEESTLTRFAIGFVVEEQGEDLILTFEQELAKSNLMICLERLD